MEFNLSNRPVFRMKDGSIMYWEPEKTVEEWFEGFEKELRALKVSVIEENVCHLLMTLNLISDILGEAR